MDRNDVLDSLAKDESFLKKVIESKTADDVKKLFAEKAVDVSDDDLNTLKQMFLNDVNETGKISDDKLDVSGGKAKWYNIAKGVAGAAVTAAAGYAIYTMKNANDAINQGMGVMDNANAAMNQGMGLMKNADDAINQGKDVMSNVDKRINNASGSWLGRNIFGLGG